MEVPLYVCIYLKGGLILNLVLLEGLFGLLEGEVEVVVGDVGDEGG